MERETDISRIQVPEGYELVKKPDPRQSIMDEIARLETELAKMQPPTEEELIEVGKQYHEYYMLDNSLNDYKESLNYGSSSGDNIKR